MPRKHRSNNAARLKQSGNAFHALGDLPLDETNTTLDGSNNGDDDDELSLLQVVRATNATLAKTAFLWGDTTKEMLSRTGSPTSPTSLAWSLRSVLVINRTRQPLMVPSCSRTRMGSL
ncbi:hypothetical protein BZA77DRAFT_359124 [Pyronema omphalodes]|nr:hypothetical protein BZA77DRAFT_359124 [Pyronema omphalodes]